MQRFSTAASAAFLLSAAFAPAADATEFRGTLGDGPAALARLFEFDCEFDRTAERIGVYANLKTTEDMADSRYQRMLGRYEHAATLAAEAASFIRRYGS